MENVLEQEAERLKNKYPRQYHSIIEHNLKWVSDEMALKPGSVDISEGLSAMTTDLPSLTGGRPRGRRVDKAGRKRMGKR
jgi:hypothetical protein